MSFVLQLPQTEEQYLKYGCAMLLYKFFKIFCGGNYFACLNAPILWEAFLKIVSRCCFQVRCLST